MVSHSFENAAGTIIPDGDWLLQIFPQQQHCTEFTSLQQAKQRAHFFKQSYEKWTTLVLVPTSMRCFLFTANI